MPSLDNQTEGRDPTLDLSMMRDPAVEAVIVRIMKSRKRLPHQDLFVASSQQIRLFQLDPVHFRQRVASLIEREYLMRDDDDMRVLVYLA